MTKKELRLLRKELTSKDDALRAKVLHILKTAPSKEKAAYDIAAKLQHSLCVSLCERIGQAQQEIIAKYNSLEQRVKKEREELEKEIKATEADDSDWWKQ